MKEKNLIERIPIIINFSKNIIWLVFFFLYSCTDKPQKKYEIDDEINAIGYIYCNCVQENIFNFRYSEDLYAYCNSQAAEKSRIFKLSHEINHLDIEKYGKDLFDSVKYFKDNFINRFDSCFSIPVKKYKSKP